MKLPLVLLAWMPLLAAADDARVSFLEQEVRNLQRQVQALSRDLDEIRTRPPRLGPGAKPVAKSAPVASDRWVDAAKWNALRPGMTELELIGSLGPPTSMREENGTRTLLYALEIGESGFLGGSVTLRDRVVVEVRKPMLQ